MRTSRLPAHEQRAGSRDDAHVVGDDAPPVERATAWDEPKTRQSYAAYRRGGLRWLAGGMLGVALAIGLSAYALLVLRRAGLGVFIIAAVILGLIGLGTGLGALLRARRYRMALQRAPWRPAELRVAGAHLRLILAEDPAVDVRLMTTSRWRVRELVGYRDREVAVCPLTKGGFVLTAPDLDNLYGVRPLTRGRAR